jgi:hypothetical protein
MAAGSSRKCHSIGVPGKPGPPPTRLRRVSERAEVKPNAEIAKFSVIEAHLSRGCSWNARQIERPTRLLGASPGRVIDEPRPGVVPNDTVERVLGHLALSRSGHLAEVNFLDPRGRPCAQLECPRLHRAAQSQASPSGMVGIVLPCLPGAAPCDRCLRCGPGRFFS